MFGKNGRIGLIVPANNSTLEPELWPRLPPEVALFSTRLLVRGDLTPDVVVAMEAMVDRAVDELTATIVDVIVYADMVTTFIMDEAWNDRRAGEIAERAGVPCITCWTALRNALDALDVRRFALGTPYPSAIHATTVPYFAGQGYEVVDDATLDIVAMTDVPKVGSKELHRLVHSLNRDGAEAIVLLATDLPTLADVERLEAETGLPVLSSNQTLLWHALRKCGNRDRLEGLGRLFGL